MSVSIESLDIQISSSAGSAVTNIDKLAKSLENLKSQGNLKGAIKNLNSLSTALNNLQLDGGKISNLRNLAGALRSLSTIQKSPGLNSIKNTLGKLPGVINALNPATLTEFVNAVSPLATALGTLSTIQSPKGLNSVIKSLRGLGELNTALGAPMIDEFTDKLQRLATALSPLATQIDKIGRAFARLPASLQQCVTATHSLTQATQAAEQAQEEHNRSLRGGQLNLMVIIDNIQSYLGAILFVQKALSGLMSGAIEWDGIQYRFGRAFGEDAEEVYDWVLKINDALKINTQEFMQYSSLYGSLLKGFGMSQDQVTTIATGLTELSYDIWAAHNDQYKTLEDAADAVKSAITGEIEPIRNAGIALTEASMQEYMDSVGMAHVSIEKLSEAQKSEVRYAVMVNAAMNQGIVGTYAREMQTAEGAVRTLSQQTKTLGQSIGSLFIPILQKVIPYISAFIDILVDAVHWIAAFFGVEIQEISWGSSVGGVSSGLEDIAAGAEDASGSLGKAGKAAKKLKDYTMGFDELNVISPPTESGGSGGGGSGGVDGIGGGSLGLDLDTLWDDALLAQASKQVDELKQKILDFFEEWKVQIAIIGGALGVLGLSKMVGHLGEAVGLGETFLSTMKTIGKLATSAIVIVLQYSLMTEFLESYIDGEGFKNYIATLFVGALGSLALYSMWGPGGLVIGLGVIAAASLSAVIDNGGITNTESAVTALGGLAAAVGAIAVAWSKLGLGALFGQVGAFFTLLAEGNSLTSVLAASFPGIASAISGFGTAISSFLAPIGTFLAGISAPVWAGIAAAVAALVSVFVFLKENWEAVKEVATKFFEEKIAPKLEDIKEHWDELCEALEPVGDFLGEIGEAFGDFFDIITDFDWESIGEAIEWLGGIIFSVFGSFFVGIFNTVVGVIENVIQVFTGFVQIVTGIFEFIGALFTGGDIEAAWSKIWDGVVNVITGLWELVTQPLEDFIGGIIDFFTDLWDELVGHSIVPDTVNGIIEWFVSLPGEIFGAIDDFVQGIIQKFKDLWDDIKSWWSSNVAPKFTLTYWKGVFAKVVNGISTKLSEIKTEASNKWNSVKTWFNTYVAPKLTLTYWKEKFKGLVNGLDEKLDEAWQKVKDFFAVDEWKKKVEDAVKAIKDNFKMPEFPKIKLSVTYDTNVGSVKKTVYEALGLEGWPSLKWSTYAQGGFPTTGEMFIAREAGPELVGNIGHRSAVANNDQIVAAVSKGVYDAVRAAMSGDSGNQSVNVYLDGKQIYASVKRIERERGASLMGSQLGYSY